MSNQNIWPQIARCLRARGIDMSSTPRHCQQLKELKVEFLVLRALFLPKPIISDKFVSKARIFFLQALDLKVALLYDSEN